ncbi:MAG: hypothetical protein ACRD4B_01535, partial [Acidobacteriota bacterium]
MRRLGVLPVLLAILLSLVMFSGTAKAQSPTYNNQIQVTGIVLPAQHIIIDRQGNIIEILSNTGKDVTPKVYLNNISKESIRELTPEIYERYQELVPKGHSHVGTLYKRAAGA